MKKITNLKTIKLDDSYCKIEAFLIYLFLGIIVFFGFYKVYNFYDLRTNEKSYLKIDLYQKAFNIVEESSNKIFSCFEDFSKRYDKTEVSILNKFCKNKFITIKVNNDIGIFQPDFRLEFNPDLALVYFENFKNIKNKDELNSLLKFSNNGIGCLDRRIGKNWRIFDAWGHICE